MEKIDEILEEISLKSIHISLPVTSQQYDFHAIFSENFPIFFRLKSVKLMKRNNQETKFQDRHRITS